MNSEQQVPERSQPQMSIWQKMVNIITVPEEVYSRLKDRVTLQDWLVPFLIAVLFTGISGMVNAPETLQLTKQAIEQQQENFANRDMSEEQRQNMNQRFEESIEKQERRYTTPQVYYWSIGRAGVGMALAILVLAAIYHFSGNTFLGAESTFLKILAVVCLAQAVTVVSAGYDILYSMVAGPGSAPSSLAVLLPFGPGDIFSVERYQQALFSLLSQIDLFTIWRLVLYGIGFRIVYSVTKAKAYGVVFGFYVFWLFVTTAASYLFAGLQ